MHVCVCIYIYIYIYTQYRQIIFFGGATTTHNVYKHNINNKHIYTVRSFGLISLGKCNPARVEPRNMQQVSSDDSNTQLMIIHETWTANSQHLGI